MKNQTLVVLTLFVVAAQATPGRSQQITFAAQPAEVLSNDKVALTVTTLGATLASIVLSDDPAKLNPLWDPVRIAREQGREVAFNGSAGHFVCVDGFGPASTGRACGGHADARRGARDAVRDVAC